MAVAKSVLVTGSAGGVGNAVCAALTHAGHRVTGFDRRPTPGVETALVADLMDRETVQGAAEGQDAIIHLAATPDEADFIDELIEPNVRGLYHVCDAARRANVPRLVLTSSVQVVTGHRWNRPVTLEDGPRVVNHYALTKLWAEDIGEMYARVYGISVIAARLGWLPRSKPHAEELLASPVGTDVYLSHTDAGRFFTACVDTDLEPSRFEVLFATSKPARKARIDLGRTTEVLGFLPRDVWPEGQPFID
ncbi:MAG: NAD(P)-dependent oxidoreductase [Gammaproteobacteria bacterium]|nr:NAD(P)-dependent oxidoreductase [Gammaproteobacteria bacterium]